MSGCWEAKRPGSREAGKLGSGESESSATFLSAAIQAFEPPGLPASKPSSQLHFTPQQQQRDVIFADN